MSSDVQVAAHRAQSGAPAIEQANPVSLSQRNTWDSSALQIETEAANDARLTVRTIRDLRDLEALRTIWESWPGTCESDLDFFSKTVGWRDDYRPHVLAVMKGETPDAILIGTWEHKKVLFKLGYIPIVSPAADVIEFVRGGFRGNTTSERNCAVLVREVIRSLDESEADFAVWRQLDVKSHLYNTALRGPRFAIPDHSRCFIERWSMNFPKGLDAFLMSLQRSRRSKLRRKYNKFFNSLCGRVQVRRVCKAEDLELAVSDMEEIASKTEKRLFGFGFFDTAQTRKQMIAAAEGGWLRIYILSIDEKPVAFWVGTLYNGCLEADYAGYDPAWKRFSPGIVLFLYIIEDLHDQDVRTADLGWGDTQFNQCFGTTRHVEAQVRIYAPTLRGIKLNMLHTATHRTTVLLSQADSSKRARRILWKQIARRRRKSLLALPSPKTEPSMQTVEDYNLKPSHSDADLLHTVASPSEDQGPKSGIA